jgi:hypothetical protein
VDSVLHSFDNAVYSVGTLELQEQKVSQANELFWMSVLSVQRAEGAGRIRVLRPTGELPNNSVDGGLVGASLEKAGRALEAIFKLFEIANQASALHPKLRQWGVRGVSLNIM